MQTMITLHDNLLQINRQGWHIQHLLCAKDVQPQCLKRLITVEQNIQIVISVDDRDQLG